jgi:hypothetical protein
MSRNSEHLSSVYNSNIRLRLELSECQTQILSVINLEREVNMFRVSGLHPTTGVYISIFKIDLTGNKRFIELIWNGCH